MYIIISYLYHCTIECIRQKAAAVNSFANKFYKRVHHCHPFSLILCHLHPRTPALVTRKSNKFACYPTFVADDPNREDHQNSNLKHARPNDEEVLVSWQRWHATCQYYPILLENILVMPSMNHRALVFHSWRIPWHYEDPSVSDWGPTVIRQYFRNAYCKIFLFV